MRKILTGLLLLFPFAAYSWGFFAHQRINQLAVFTIQGDPGWFFRQHIKYLTLHAVDADKRRYADTLEAPRHYLDVEHYHVQVDDIPRQWKDALEKYGATHLQKNGIIPWHIHRVYINLVNAFKAAELSRILRTAADLGHYVGDAHVPLHTTSNHNGQLTNQVGLHAFWESRLPELFSNTYNFIVGNAVYFEDPLAEAWRIVSESRSLVDAVLTQEALLNNEYPKDKKYSFSERNNVVLKQYSAAYSLAYQTKLNGMVEKRMRAAIHTIGSFWYSAWVDAGQPDLTKVLTQRSSKKEAEKQTAGLEKAFQKGQIKGREL